MDIEISVVIPCLNEETNIKICIEKCFESFSKLGVSGEVIVVDNNCTDNTAEIALSSGAKVVRCEKIGYGYSLREGFANASGLYIVMGDGDNTYDFLEIPKFYKAITSLDCDMVTGARIGLAGSETKKGAMPFLHKYIGTPFLTFIFNLFYRTHISDINCGFRIFKHEILNQIKLKSGGMELASELFVEFVKNKFSIKEIPITLYASVGRTSKLSTFKDGFRLLCYLVSALQK